MTIKTYTKRQEAIYQFTERYWLEHGYGPGLAEIVDALHLNNKSVVWYNLRVLEHGGRISSEPNVARSTRPTNIGEAWKNGRLVETVPFIRIPGEPIDLGIITLKYGSGEVTSG